MAPRVLLGLLARTARAVRRDRLARQVPQDPPAPLDRLAPPASRGRLVPRAPPDRPALPARMAPPAPPAHQARRAPPARPGQRVPRVPPVTPARPVALAPVVRPGRPVPPDLRDPRVPPALPARPAPRAQLVPLDPRVQPDLRALRDLRDQQANGSPDRLPPREPRSAGAGRPCAAGTSGSAGADWPSRSERPVSCRPTGPAGRPGSHGPHGSRRAHGAYWRLSCWPTGPNRSCRSHRPVANGCPGCHRPNRVKGAERPDRSCRPTGIGRRHGPDWLARPCRPTGSGSAGSDRCDRIAGWKPGRPSWSAGSAGSARPWCVHSQLGFAHRNHWRQRAGRSACAAGRHACWRRYGERNSLVDKACNHRLGEGLRRWHDHVGATGPS